MSTERFGSPAGRPRNRLGEVITVSVPADDYEADVDDDGAVVYPSATLITPSGTVDLSGDVWYLNGSPAVERTAEQPGQFAVPERWQITTPPATEVGEHRLEFCGQTFVIDVDDTVNPRKAARQKGDTPDPANVRTKKGRR